MGANPPPDPLNPELSAQLAEVTEKEIAIYRASLLASTAARTGFHEKLTVLTAGSLTIVATMATSIYVRPLTVGSITHRSLELLATSSILFFLSLTSSLIHNFMETEALHFEARAENRGMIRKIFRA
jgi:hypothetical protein